MVRLVGKQQGVKFEVRCSSIESLENIQVSVRFDNYEDLHGSTGCNSCAKHFKIDVLHAAFTGTIADPVVQAVEIFDQPLVGWGLERVQKV